MTDRPSSLENASGPAGQNRGGDAADGIATLCQRLQVCGHARTRCAKLRQGDALCAVLHAPSCMRLLACWFLRGRACLHANVRACQSSGACVCVHAWQILAIDTEHSALEARAYTCIHSRTHCVMCRCWKLLKDQVPLPTHRYANGKKQ